MKQAHHHNLKILANKNISNKAKNCIAQVVTPDLRGDGINPDKRGDVDYIGQLDDDKKLHCLKKHRSTG